MATKLKKRAGLSKLKLARRSLLESAPWRKAIERAKVIDHRAQPAYDPGKNFRGAEDGNNFAVLMNSAPLSDFLLTWDVGRTLVVRDKVHGKIVALRGGGFTPCGLLYLKASLSDAQRALVRIAFHGAATSRALESAIDETWFEYMLLLDDVRKHAIRRRIYDALPYAERRKWTSVVKRIEAGLVVRAKGLHVTPAEIDRDVDGLELISRTELYKRRAARGQKTHRCVH